MSERIMRTRSQDPLCNFMITQFRTQLKSIHIKLWNVLWKVANKFKCKFKLPFSQNTSFLRLALIHSTQYFQWQFEFAIFFLLMMHSLPFCHCYIFTFWKITEFLFLFSRKISMAASVSKDQALQNSCHNKASQKSFPGEKTLRKLLSLYFHFLLNKF